MNVEPRLTDELNRLLLTRTGGARNISGLRFQLLYSILRTLDLYESQGNPEVQFEGLEDVDFKGLNIGSSYYQVKTSRSKQGWELLNKTKLLDRFNEVYKLDNDAHFIVVTNFGLTGLLDELARYCNDEVGHLARRALRTRACRK